MFVRKMRVYNKWKREEKDVYQCVTFLEAPRKIFVVLRAHGNHDNVPVS